LQEVHNADGIGDKQAIRLKRAIVDSLLPTTDVTGVEDALIRDAVGDEALMRAAVTSVLRREIGAEPTDLELRVHHLDAEDIRVETNLQALLSIELDEEHRLVQQAILGIGGLNLRVATMRHHECVMALDDADLPLLTSKLDFLDERGPSRRSGASPRTQRHGRRPSRSRPVHTRLGGR